MERFYYIQRDNATAETSDRFEAARIAAEWARRGYAVSAIAVDATEKSVQLVDDWDGKSGEAGQEDLGKTRHDGRDLPIPVREPAGRTGTRPAPGELHRRDD